MNAAYTLQNLHVTYTLHTAYDVHGVSAVCMGLRTLCHCVVFVCGLWGFGQGLSALGHDASSLTQSKTICSN